MTRAARGGPGSGPSGGRGRGVGVLLLLLAVLAGPSRAHGAGHGWVVVFRDPEGDLPLRLVHVPPRSILTMGGEPRVGAAAGELRPTLALGSRPAAIASVGDRVYVAMTEGGSGDGSGVIRVGELRVLPSPIAGWYDDPADYFRSMAPLPGDLAIEGLSGVTSSGGVGVVLLATGARDGRRVLLTLRDGSWGESAWPPAEVEGGGSRFVLEGTVVPAPWGERVGVLTAGAMSADGRITWGRHEVVFPSAREGSWSASFAGGLVFVHGTDAGGVWSVEQVVGAGATRAVWSSDEVGADASVAFLGGASRRMVVVWPERPAAGEAGRPRSRLLVQRTAEVSLVDGRELYAGPVRSAGAVRASEYRVLAIVLCALMLAVLIVVVRPARDPGDFAMPSGHALAEPWRRLVASLIDLVVVALVLGALTGYSAVEFLTLRALVIPGLGPLSLFAISGCGLAMGTLGDWVLGGTPGKLAMGLRVIREPASGETAAQAAGPVGAFVRNAVKWVVPPVAALGLLEPTARHRGDVFARTAVVVRTPESGE